MSSFSFTTAASDADIAYCYCFFVSRACVCVMPKAIHENPYRSYYKQIHLKIMIQFYRNSKKRTHDNNKNSISSRENKQKSPNRCRYQCQSILGNICHTVSLHIFSYTHTKH